MSRGQMSSNQGKAGKDAPERFDGRFLLERTLGRGASSAVYAAIDEVSGERVAVKRLFGHVDHGILRRECANLRAVEHPRVVRLRELGRTSGGESYLVMDLVEGKPLTEALEGTDEQTVVRVFLSLLEALDAVHATGLVHGDLKPENVMVVSSGAGLVAHVLDLGLAAASGGSDLRGSPPYMAPEIIRREPVEAAADLYSVGCMLYEVLSGIVPFTGDTAHAIMNAHLRQPVPPIIPQRGAVHPELVEVTRRLLAKDPEQRFPSAGAVMMALADIAGGAAALVESLGPLPFVARPSVQRAVLDRVADAAAGQGGAVLLEGASGAGKTRLVDELRHELRLEGHAAPLVVVRAQDPRPLGFLHDLAEHLYRESTAAGMPVPRALMALLREGGDGATVEGTQAEWLQRVGESAVRLLTRACAGRPVVIFIDGAEDIPAELIGPLRAVAVSSRSLRALLVVVTRPESAVGRMVRELPEEVATTETVAPLADSEALALVERVLGPRGERRLAERIVEDSQGLPRALEGRLRGLVERRVLVRAPGGWALAATAPPVEALELPRVDDLDAMTAERLGRLDPGDLDVLAATALLGHAPAVHAVSRLLRAGREGVREAAARLVDRGLASVDAARDTLSLPAHVARVALLAADPTRLRRWQQDLAAGLKTQRERGGATAATLEQETRLWLACGNEGAALALAREAARALAKERAPGRALALLDELAPLAQRDAAWDLLVAGLCADTGDLERATTLYEALTAGDTTPDVLRRYGEVLGQKGELLAAEEPLSRAAASAQSLTPDAAFELWNAVAWNRMMRGAFAPALAEAERALGAAHEAQQPALVVRGLRLVANIHWQKGDWAAAEAPAREAAERAEAAGDQRGLAEATLVLATCARFQGRQDEARAGYEAARLRFEELGLATRAGKCFNNLGVVAYVSGNWREATRHWEGALQVCERTGDQQEQVALANNLGVLYRDQGDLQRSAASFKRALAVAERVGLERMVAAILGNLGETHLRAGRLTEAVRTLDRAVTLARKLGARDEVAECTRRLAEAELRSGGFDDAERMAREAATTCEALGALAEKAGACLIVAAARRSRGELDAARESCEEAAKAADDAGDPFVRAHVHLERAHLAIAEDRPSIAAQELDKGEETYKKLGARWHLDQVSALRLRSRRPTTVDDGSLDGAAARIVALGSKLATIEDMDTLLRAVLDEMLDVTAAERGFVILVDEDLRPVRKCVEDRTDQRSTSDDARCSRTATDEALQSGRPVVLTNIDLDDRYNKQQSILALDLRSITCLPLKLHGKVLGVLYVDSRMAGDQSKVASLAVLEAMASQASIAVENMLLVERERERMDLVGTIAHELRSPLMGIVGYLGMLQLEDNLSDEARSSVDFVVSQAERLGRTVTNVMDLVRMDRNTTSWSLTPLDPGILIESAVRSLQPMATMKGQTLTWEVNDRIMDVIGSSDRIAQVLTNLITNALKFTPEGGVVTVRASVVDARPDRSSTGFELGPRVVGHGHTQSSTGFAVRFDVSDTGPGISEEDQARIFQRFSQASRGKAGRAGLGLGLSIAREIVHRHSGSIWIESEVGAGSTFSFTVPAVERV
ncbi:MAG: hypothetical protein AMXMBFR64_22320 [Myxococcales bacterium]